MESSPATSPNARLEPAELVSELLPKSRRSRGLEIVIAACQLPNSRALKYSLERLLQIFETAPWLEEALTSVTADARIRIAAKLAINSHDPRIGDAAIESRGYTNDASIYASLFDRVANPDDGLERLRALLILAAVWRAVHKDDLHNRVPLSQAAIDILASSIRTARDQPFHALQHAVQAARQSNSISDLAARVSKTLGAKGLSAVFVEQWPRLSSWLESEGWNAAPAPPNTDKIFESPRATPRFSPPEEDVFRPVMFFGVSPDKAFGPEPPSESGIELPSPGLPDVLPPHSQIPSLRSEVNAARQRVWLQNSDLLVDHNDVISDAELFHLLPAVKRRIEEDIQSKKLKEAKLGIDVLLGLATGRVARLLAATTIVSTLSPEPVDHLEIGLAERSMKTPIVRPKGAFVPPPGTAHLYEQVADYLDIPLPPSLVKLINAFAASGYRPVASPKDETDFDLVLDQYLRADFFDDVPSLARRFGRVRRRFAAQLKRFTADIAPTMVLSGDTLGRSDAPLYYYAPESSELTNKYVSAIWPLFGDEPKPSRKGGGMRVGAAGLVKVGKAKKRVRKICGQLNIPKVIEGLSQLKWFALVHNRMTDFSANSLRLTSTHRPTMALFDCTRWDIDVFGHSAVLTDKKTDLAHRIRFAALIKGTSRQICLLLSHLEALVHLDQAPASLKKRAMQALDGSKSLFFHVNEDLYPREITDFGEWAEGLPLEWQDIPANWYRTFTATGARELGAPGLLLLIQLGHLDAAGHPYAQDSFLTPQSFADALRPSLEQLWKSVGLHARSGLAKKPHDCLSDLPPLKDWSEQIAVHQREVSRATIELRRSFRASRKTAMDSARPVVLEAIKSVLPKLHEQLVELLRVRPNPKKSRRKEIASENFNNHTKITDQELQKIRTAIEEATEGDPIGHMAGHNTLCKLLRRARTELCWVSSDIRLWVAGAGAQPAPFLKGMMLARMQVHALRLHLLSCQTISDGHELYVRSLLWIMLFTPCINAEAAKALLGDPVEIGRLSQLNDVLLASHPYGERQNTYGTRGLASLAVSAGRCGDSPTTTPTAKEIASVLPRFLPPWARTRADDFLTNLTSTLLVSQIIEMSPIARVASREGASAHASIPFQRSLLEGEFAGPGNPDQLEVTAPRPPRPPPKSRDEEQMKSKYRKLTGILNVKKGEQKYFLLTGKLLKGGKGKRARTLKQNELKAFIQAIADQPLDVVRCLAEFALHLVVHGTPKELKPAHSTISTYVTTLGGRLLTIAPLIDIHAFSGEEFSDLYEAVLEPFSGKSAARTAAQVWLFHDVLVEKFGIEDFDKSWLHQYFVTFENSADTCFVTPAEYVQARDMLIRSVAGSDRSNDLGQSTNRRLDRASLVALILLRCSGARSSEGCLLRHRDLVIGGDEVSLFVRASFYAWLKTPAARRLVNIGPILDGTERAILVSWINDEKARLGAQFHDRLPLLMETDSSNPIPVELIRKRLIELLSAVCGRKAKLHQLRHLWAQERIASLHLSVSDREHWDQLGALGFRALVCASVDGLGQPSDLRATAIQLGHRSAITSILSYFHMTWLLYVYAPARYQDWLKRRFVAAASNRTPGANDKVIPRGRAEGGDHSQADALVSGVLDIEVGPSDRDHKSTQRESIEIRSDAGEFFSAGDLARLMWSVDEGTNFQQVCRAWGLSDSASSALAEGAAALNAKCHYRLLPGTTLRGNTHTSPRPRNLSGGNPFQSWLEDGGAPHLSQLLVNGYMPSTQGLRLDERDAEVLRTAVSALDVGPAGRIGLRTDAAARGFAVFRAFRSGNSVSLDRLLAWTLAVLWLYQFAASVSGQHQRQ